MRESTLEELKNSENIIYLIHNKINGKNYIGQTLRTFSERYGTVFSGKSQPKTYISSEYFIRAIEKHGYKNFSIHILEKNKTLEDLNFYEYFYAEIYNCYAPIGYNVRKCGENQLHHEETKRKIGDSHAKIYSIRNNKTDEIVQVKNLFKFCEDQGIDSSLLGTVLKYNDKKRRRCGIFTHPDHVLKKYRLLSPDGKLIILIEGEIKKFCRENNLIASSVFLMFRGKYKEHNGWKCPDFNFKESTKYFLISPEEEKFIINQEDLKKFCEFKGIGKGMILRVIRGKSKNGSHRGWKAMKYST